MSSSEGPFWLTQAKSARSDTWVNFSRAGETVLQDIEILEALKRGDDSALKGIELRVTNRGRNVGDMLWAQGGMYVPISQRAVDTLNDMGASGWRSVPIGGRFGNGDPLPGYQILVVTGECGDFMAKAEREHRETGVDPSLDWDGSDVFWIRTRPSQFTFCIANRVRKAFEAAGLERIEYEDPKDF